MKRTLIVVAAALALLAVALPAGATPPQDVTISVSAALRGDLTASTTTGTFSVSGAIADSGTETGAGRFAGLGHLKTGGPNSLHATQTLVGQQGTISIRLVGLFGQLPAAIATGEGRWVITGGTGAYADLNGEGSWTATADFRPAIAGTGPPIVTFTLIGQVH